MIAIGVSRGTIRDGHSVGEVATITQLGFTILKRIINSSVIGHSNDKYNKGFGHDDTVSHSGRIYLPNLFCDRVIVNR